MIIIYVCFFEKLATNMFDKFRYVNVINIFSIFRLSKHAIANNENDKVTFLY